MHVVERVKVPFVNLCRDLVANVQVLQNVGFIRRIRHRHRAHPAFNFLAVDPEGLRIEIDLFNLPAKRIFLFTGVLFVLACVAGRNEQTEGDSNQ